MNKKIIVALLIVLAIALGFLRDYIFVTINRFIESGSDVSGRLGLLKWVLTALFCLLYLALCCTMLYVLFRDGKYVRFAVFSYFILLGPAVLTAVILTILDHWGEGYPYVRAVLGVAQSPIPMMVLTAIAVIDQRLVKK